MAKLTPRRAARDFIRPIQMSLSSRRISVESLTKEYTRVSGRRIAPQMVWRWLMNKGRPVEPKVGAALILKRAFENLTGREK